MPEIVDPAERLDQLLNAAEPRIARIFRAAVEHVKSELDLEELTQLIADGRWEQALDYIQQVAEHLGTAAHIEFIMAGQSTAAFLAGADVAQVAFDVVNHRAVEAMQAQKMDAILGFTADQRLAVQRVMLDGVVRGLNPRDQARNFRDVVGLTDTQSQAVLNYRRLLEQAGDGELPKGEQREALTRALRDGRYDRAVERAINDSKPLSPTQIDRMVTRYAERYVKYRAEVIGRTQGLRAVNEGNEHAYQQAIDAGQVNPDDLDRKWTTKLDGRERDSHHELNGQHRKWGQTWQGKYGELRYPGDPRAPAAEIVQCRCRVTTRIRMRA